MDDLEFDKHFANKMRQTSAPDFSDEDWARLSPMLVSRQKRKSRVLPLWWLGALSGLLLCSNIGWWWMWRQSEKRIDALRTEWIQMQPQKIRLTDTTYARTVVYQYDTVYRTKSIPSFRKNRHRATRCKGRCLPKLVLPKAPVQVWKVS